MTIHLYDTKLGSKRLFEPMNAGVVTMYLCGPTVYNYAHIGNARPAVVFDLLARVLRREYKLVFARNITDVDDKINAAAIAANKPIDAITATYIEAYNADMAALGVGRPDIEPRATEHIADMIAMITALIDSGHAYAAEGHVMFDVTRYPDYGALSKRNVREMIAGARVEVAPYKKSPHDFVLWKPSTPELPGWESPWGRGRPGWHIECSAMAARHLGTTIDIHAGGQDLVFPHHENERAQSICAHGGAPFVRYWLHNGFLSIDQGKMSKSQGNVILVHELIKSVPGEVIRLALLSAHYRQPLDWSVDTLAFARRMLDRLYGAIRGVTVPPEMRVGTAAPAAVVAALHDDLNTPKAMAALFAMSRAVNRANNALDKERLAAGMLAAGELLGLLQSDPETWFAGATEGGRSVDELSADDIDVLLTARQQARAARDFAAADAIRERLTEAGIGIEDSADGTIWRRVN